MRFDVFTLFPEVMQKYLQTSILGRAGKAGKIDVRLHNIRDYAADKHRTTDDVPFGGGGGMVMKAEPIFSALEAVLGEELNSVRIVLLTPQGRPFKQSVAKDYSKQKRLALICGRYEGVDERVRQHLATDEVSVGDYVLTGGGKFLLCWSLMRLHACSPGFWGMNWRQRRIPTPEDYWNTPTILVRQTFVAGLCPKYCVPVIMPGLKHGGMKIHCAEHFIDALICCGQSS